MKVIVIYHRADFDGIFCREIAKRFFANSDYDVEYIGWDYGDAVPALRADDRVYMLDISVDGLMDHPFLHWVDHHKSAIEKFNPEIVGYRIDGVAACRLAWQYFGGLNQWKGQGMPTKNDFVDRLVDEPHAVRLAGEYDIWDKRDSNAELFQHGLRSQDLDEVWPVLLSQTPESYGLVTKLLTQGQAIQYAQERQNESIIRELGFTVEFEGLCFLACNAARYNSLLFSAGQLPQHDAFLGFKWDGKRWSVSLYHARGKEHWDLSTIAVKHGGGGHRGACGFKAATLPFVA